MSSQGTVAADGAPQKQRWAGMRPTDRWSVYSPEVHMVCERIGGGVAGLSEKSASGLRGQERGAVGGERGPALTCAGVCEEGVWSGCIKSRSNVHSTLVAATLLMRCFRCHKSCTAQLPPCVAGRGRKACNERFKDGKCDRLEDEAGEQTKAAEYIRS